MPANHFFSTVPREWKPVRRIALVLSMPDLFCLHRLVPLSGCQFQHLVMIHCHSPVCWPEQKQIVMRLVIMCFASRSWHCAEH